jgi:hypothetical protein
MAKKARGQTEEQKMVWRLSDMLREANFNIQHQLDLGKSAKPDLVAEREDLGRYRRYAIDVVNCVRRIVKPSVLVFSFV